MTESGIQCSGAPGSGMWAVLRWPSASMYVCNVDMHVPGFRNGGQSLFCFSWSFLLPFVPSVPAPTPDSQIKMSGNASSFKRHARCWCFKTFIVYFVYMWGAVVPKWIWGVSSLSLPCFWGRAPLVSALSTSDYLAQKLLHSSFVSVSQLAIAMLGFWVHSSASRFFM